MTIFPTLYYNHPPGLPPKILHPITLVVHPTCYLYSFVYAASMLLDTIGNQNNHVKKHYHVWCAERKSIYMPLECTGIVTAAPACITLGQ